MNNPAAHDVDSDKLRPSAMALAKGQSMQAQSATAEHPVSKYKRMLAHGASSSVSPITSSVSAAGDRQWQPLDK